MRACRPTKVHDWLFGQDHDRADDETAEQPFDSFGPMTNIRRALHRPSLQTGMQGPHDCTRVLVAEGDAYHRRVLRVLLAVSY
ncbi:MAG: hypothetical protein ABL956_06690, partial [Hyphomonadaceae bacterium]